MKTARPRSSPHALAWMCRHPFGLFVHWGAYALLERCEWAMMCEEWPRAEYEPLTRRFTGRKFDADALARLARDAGMSFMCMTTKHHDGFCLFDSRLTDYTTVRRAAGRDFIAEYVRACRRHGLRVGLYYSLMDWHHPDWLARQRGDRAGHRRFLDYIHGQLRELCTRYGKLDLLFYDVAAPYAKPEEWRAREMNAMVRRLQPGIVINDRNRLPGDFSTPEQMIHAEPPGRAWQTCMTLNENWAWAKGDTLWKSPKYVATLLQRIVGQGGSFLLNVGPKPDGTLPAKAVKILSAVGQWMRRNGEALYNANPQPIVFCAVGGHTVVGDRAYVHVQHWAWPELGVGGIESRVTRVVCLANRRPVRFEQTGTRLRLLDLPARPPDPLVTVFRIEVAGRLKIRPLGVWPASLRAPAAAAK